MFYILLLLQAQNPFAIRQPEIPWSYMLGLFALLTVSVFGAAFLKVMFAVFFNSGETEYEEPATSIETATVKTSSAAVSRCQYCGVKSSGSTNKCGSCGAKF